MKKGELIKQLETKTPFELFIEQLETEAEKCGGGGAFNLVGKTTNAILKLAKGFQKLENYKHDAQHFNKSRKRQ